LHDPVLLSGGAADRYSLVEEKNNGGPERTVTSLASKCPLCGSTNIKLHLEGTPHALDPMAFGSSRRELSFGRILRCEVCNLGFSETRPAEDQLMNLYRQLDVTVYEAEAPGRTRTAQRHLSILRRYAAQPGRLLDVGCASGRFLSACADAGWEVVGLEPSQALSELAKRLLQDRAEILPVTLQEATFDPSCFDAVTMWDVLEHVPYPSEFLRKAATLLKPGGFLLANVPNLDSLQARFWRSRWPLFLPEHLNYFNRQSLALCGEQSGVQLVAFGSRPVNFSVGYILYRASQHIPQFSRFHGFVSTSAIANWVVPVWMGELYAVWNKAYVS
jgi:SAM-dependent methyltransferase